MKLADWLAETGTSQTEFAKLVDLSSASVSRLVHGTQKPDLQTLQAIRAATRDRVGLDDFEPPLATKAS